MKLSTRGRYGVRAMLDLATHYGEGTVLLKDIAKRQEISERYLENIIRVLVANDLVNSTRGRSGGFSLAKPPGEIRLRQIIEAVEGSIASVFCVDNPKLCRRTPICVTREVWERLKKAMQDVLDSMTLRDLVEMEKEKLTEPEAQMYYI